MDPYEYGNFAEMRAELMRDYQPENAHERLLAYEVAASWRRLDYARRQEINFFDLQKHAHAIRDGQPPEAYKEEGREVVMWLDEPHKAYDQIKGAIREADQAFDRAIRRIEASIDRRFRRQRLIGKEIQASQPESEDLVLAAGSRFRASTPFDTIRHISPNSVRQRPGFRQPHAPPLDEISQLLPDLRKY